MSMHWPGKHVKEATEVLVRDLELDEVKVDAFWSFVGKGAQDELA